jgi:hypothetical protein
MRHDPRLRRPIILVLDLIIGNDKNAHDKNAHDKNAHDKNALAGPGMPFS